MYGKFPLNAHLDSHCHALLIAIETCKAIAEQTSSCCAIGCMASFTDVCQTTLVKKSIAVQLH